MTVSVIKLDISTKKHPTQLYIYCFATENMICKNQYPFKFWVSSCKVGVPPHTVIAMQSPNVVYATNILKITKFSERLKDRTLRKYKFMNSFNVETDFKRYTVLPGTTCVWKMQHIQQEYVWHAFKSFVFYCCFSFSFLFFVCVCVCVCVCVLFYCFSFQFPTCAIIKFRFRYCYLSLYIVRI